MTCSCRAGIASGIVLLAMLVHGKIAALFLPKAAKHSMDPFAGLDVSGPLRHKADMS